MLILVHTALAWTCAGAPFELDLPSTFGDVLHVHVGGSTRELPAQMIHEFRLRDAEGRLVPWRAEMLGQSLRYTPETAVAPGTYTLEQFVWYAEDGRRLEQWRPSTQGGLHGAWFPVRDVEHVVGGPAPKVPSVTWDHQTSGELDFLRATITADPSTSRVDIEVRGLGVYDSRSWKAGGPLELGYGGHCNPGKNRVPRGDFDVRVVAESSSGKRTPGPWTALTVMNPSNPFYSLPFFSLSRSGTPLNGPDLTSWTPIVLEPPIGVPPPTSMACTLVPDAPPKALFAVPDGTTAFAFTAKGDLRAAWLDDGDVMVNGKRYTTPSTPEPSVVEFRSDIPDLVVIRGKDASCVGQEFWWSLAKLEGDIARPVFTARKTFRLDPERTPKGYKVTWRTGEQRRFEQDLGPDFQPLGKAREVLLPIVLRPPLVNGRPVLDDGSPAQSTVYDNRVYALQFVGSGTRVMAIDEKATIQWEHTVPDAVFNSFKVDADGVHFTTVRGQSLRLTLAGKPAEAIHDGPFDPPSPPVGDRVQPKMLGSRAVVMNRAAIHTVSQGVCSDDFVLPMKSVDPQVTLWATLWSDEDEVRVAWLEGGQALQQTLRCGPGETVVPPCWTLP